MAIEDNILNGFSEALLKLFCMLGQMLVKRARTKDQGVAVKLITILIGSA
jgi:hypothetical protein